jgi:hypothetical protein
MDYDLLAAARVVVMPGVRDQARLTRLAGLARGGPVQPYQLAEAARAVEAGWPPESKAPPGIMFTLSRLIAGKIDAIAFVELGADEVSVQALMADPRGVPVQLASDSLPWTSILPLLPASRDLRHLRMAGGVGVPPDGPGRYRSSAGNGGAGSEDTGPAALFDAIDDAIYPALARLSAAAAAAVAERMMSQPGDPPGTWRGGSNPSHRGLHRLDTVLVRRKHCWPLLDDAAKRARAVLRPVTEIVALGTQSLAQVVDGIAARAPLRYRYDLVLAEVNPHTGAVRPLGYPLFPAGLVAPPDKPPLEVPVTVSSVPEHSEEHLALPVVVRSGPGKVPLRDESLLDMVLISASPGETVRLRARFSRPGQVKLSDAAGRVLGDSPRPLPSWTSWPEILDSGPDRIRLSAGDLDLVVVVELGGERQVVRERVGVVQGVVMEFLAERAARIAVLGYRDHYGRHRVDAIAGPHAREDEALVVGCGLSVPSQALSVFGRQARWHAVPVHDDHAAPIEEALRMLTGDTFGWRPGARHVLLTVGSRPPHPHRVGPEGHVALPCPHHLLWERSLRRLKSEQAVECFAVLDRPAAAGYARRAWDELGEHGWWRLRSPAANPPRLKEAVTRVPRRPAKLRLAALPEGSTRQPREEAGR